MKNSVLKNILVFFVLYLMLYSLDILKIISIFDSDLHTNYIPRIFSLFSPIFHRPLYG